jgi:hypothetical protein
LATLVSQRSGIVQTGGVSTADADSPASTDADRVSLWLMSAEGLAAMQRTRRDLRLADGFDTDLIVSVCHAAEQMAAQGERIESIPAWTKRTLRLRATHLLEPPRTSRVRYVVNGQGGVADDPLDELVDPADQFDDLDTALDAQRVRDRLTDAWFTKPPWSVSAALTVLAVLCDEADPSDDCPQPLNGASDIEAAHWVGLWYAGRRDVFPDSHQPADQPTDQRTGQPFDQTITKRRSRATTEVRNLLRAGAPSTTGPARCVPTLPPTCRSTDRSTDGPTGRPAGRPAGRPDEHQASVSPHHGSPQPPASRRPVHHRAGVMNAPLLGTRAYVAEFDADVGSLSLRANAPGPAGALVVQFHGLTLALDAAAPRQLSSIDIADARATVESTTQPSLLTRLVGAEVVSRLATLMTIDKQRPQRIDGPRRGRDEPVPEAVARLVIAMTGADTPGLSEQEAVFATLEAMTIAHELGLADDLSGTDDRLTQAATTIAALTWSQLDAFDGSSWLPASDAAEQAAAWLPPPLCDALRFTAKRLRADAPDGLAAVLTFPAPAAAVPAAAAPEPRSLLKPHPAIALSPDSLPLAVANRVPTVSRTTNDECEVRLRGWSDRAAGWWVRAFIVDQRVPLAVVPMLTDERDAVATFLLPPSSGAKFEIDIVDDPAVERPSERVAAFRAAIASGQRAARLERLDRPHDAADAWRRASRFHRSAGDTDRARQADAMIRGQRPASRRSTTTSIQPTLADRYLSS